MFYIQCSLGTTTLRGEVGWWWTGVPQSFHPTLKILHPRDDITLWGTEREQGPLYSAPVLPGDQIPFISSSPRGVKQQTTNRRSIKLLKEWGSWGR